MANETALADSGSGPPLMSAHVQTSERPWAATWAQSASLNPCRRRQAFRIFIGLSLLALSAPVAPSEEAAVMLASYSCVRLLANRLRAVREEVAMSYFRGWDAQR